MSDNEPTAVPKSPIVSLLVCLTLCFLVAFIGSQASFIGLQGWYQVLAKPVFNPPSWLFAPVWTVLYFMMGIALWQVWRSPASKARSTGLAIFAVQLILNGLWSWIFFAWHKLPIAFFEIVLLDILILATILVFNKVRSSASWLLVPYLAWCCFATLLSFSIWKLNPAGDDPRSEGIRIEMGEQ